MSTTLTSETTNRRQTSAYERWVERRPVTTLGTNDGAPPLAFQGWHHFKEAFSPELVRRAVDESELQVRKCLDPFGGSGTTALACQLMGIQSTTIEVNPFLADLISAKTTQYDEAALIRSFRKVVRRVASGTARSLDALPATFVEPGVKGRWIFDRAVAVELAALIDAIDAVDDPDHQRLFRVLLGGMLTRISNVVVSGKGRRYRRNWCDTSWSQADVRTLFQLRVEDAIADIHSFSHSKQLANVIRGDARRQSLGRKKFDLTVFSPPYPNSFDYTDVYNLELWVLGYLRDTTDNKLLRTSTLSSHVQTHRQYSDAPESSPTLNAVLRKLERRREDLWSKWIPEMVGAYFADMVSVLSRLRGHIAHNGQCWMVVGDSSYGGVLVPVAKILDELAPSTGWQPRQAEACRSMRSSAQQGWDSTLKETLLIWSAAREARDDRT